jgi:Zn-dependent protease
MLITGSEILNIFIMTVAVAFIFRRSLRLDQHFSIAKSMVYAGVLTAPAIILHEFGHKFVAMGFGMGATFEIPIFWLGLGVVLALVNAPFMFFIPAYINVVGQGTPIQSALISIAGPAVNLLLYLVALLIIKSSGSKLSHNTYMFWTFTKKINGFLFLFNMIPIPPFDGFGFFSNVLKVFGF